MQIKLHDTKKSAMSTPTLQKLIDVRDNLNTEGDVLFPSLRPLWNTLPVDVQSSFPSLPV